ncbi:MAG: serine/threonine protein kinase [Chloroflexi bacterium]|nr:serine/threonine protein kinase [Chloroflexota bacterium]
MILKPGEGVRTDLSGVVCKVERFLGGGGQGEVYQANLEGKSVALKWYFPASATAEQLAILETLIKAGPPSEKFLWPMELASAQGVPGFGYIMPLRDPHYKGIVDLMKRRIEPTFRALATAGFELADSFLQLHAKGLCYRDISWNNVFFAPDTGEISICDNDNVVVDGASGGGILGTPRFMAPEIVRGEALPSTQTDLFSLAVLLFLMFIMHHPLEGKKELTIKCFDLPAMTKLYGTEPLFIFDTNDSSNEPVSGYHDNALVFWPIYPEFIRELFTRAFTAGILDPQNGRVRESEWRAAMVRLRDSIIYCTYCGMENFYDIDSLRMSGGRPNSCWSCKKEVKAPPRIRIGENIIMLNHDTQLFPHHVDDQRRYDFSRPIAEVTRHAADPRIWGLKNISNEKWVIITTSGAVKDVVPGQSVTLATGTKVQFGRKEGEIRL